MARNSAELLGVPDELQYWIPGEMVVVVQLPRRLAEDEQDVLAEQVRAQLNALLSPHNLLVETYGTYGRWRVTPMMPPIRRRAFIFGLHRQQPLAAIFFHVRHTDPAVTDPMPLAVSHLQVRLEQMAQVGLQIVSIMPNWLVTAAPVHYSAGGAALPPRPAPPLDVAAKEKPPLGWHTSFVNQGTLLDPNGGQEVTIAVLDTAHHPDRLLSAASRPEFQRHWLLQRLANDLRSENGAFEINYDRYPLPNDVRTGRDRYGEASYYMMPDHGIFVAGIIRDLLPRARIRLIRILNDYGACDLYNLFAALTDLEKELAATSTRRFVINLSLTVMPDALRLPYIWFDDRQWASTQLASVTRVLAHIEEGLRLLFESLFAHGALIVAAAGNDSQVANKQGQRIRPPRAPARFETTMSATSVNSRARPSLFANMAGVPSASTGVATFGGDSDGLVDANELPDAVRGVYISSVFPSNEQNTSGWADWSGSSFSAAIISALAGHLMARGLTASDTMSRITAGREQRTDRLYGSRLEAPTLLANIIRAQQRFGL
ncbi:MAG: S8/S53 family peptidase [Chloroflexota bacterium]|nr:S8/S53 family peptidase [Chloroflexota bacterium]